MARQLARLVADAIRRRGTFIMLRTIQATEQGPIPAVIDQPTRTGPVAQGATTLALDALSATGQLVPGDVITIAGEALTVGAAVVARPLSLDGTPGFDGVTFMPALAAAAAAGAAVTIAFQADAKIKALLNTYASSLVDGTNIQVQDLRVQIAAYNQAKPDPTTQKLVINGDVRSIIRSDPAFGPAGEIEKWVIQAR
jgi:hypothetical protein